MEWLFFAIIAMLFWTVVNLLDKHIIESELRDPTLVTAIFGFGISMVMIIFALLNGDVFADNVTVIYSILAGIMYSGGLWFYYHVMQKEEVSRFVPILATEPMFIALVAFLILEEKLSLIQYGAILIIFLGAILISHQDGRKKSLERKLHLLAILSVLFFVARNIIFGYTTGLSAIHPVLFWTGVGGLIVPFVLLLCHHPHLKRKAKKGIQHLFLNSFLSGFAIIFFAKAISVGQVSIISAMIATKPLLVFLVTLLMSRIHPTFISEKNTRKDVIKKSFATVLIVIGGMLLVVFG